MNFPNRCHRSNDVVECVILVDDGKGSLSFEGGKTQEKLSDYVIAEDATETGDFPINAESLAQKVVDFSCMEGFESGGFDVMKEEQVVTMEETCIQTPTCLVTGDVIEIEVNNRDQLLTHDYEEIQNSAQIVFDSIHNEVVQ